MKKEYSINTYRTVGQIWQLKENRISFDDIYSREEYDTIEKAQEAFDKLVAEQGFEGQDNIGKNLYYVIYHSLEETEIEILEDGTEEIYDCKFIRDNFSDLDLSWEGYEE